MYLVTLETVPSDTCFAVEKKLAFWDIPLNMSQVAAAFFFFFFTICLQSLFGLARAENN